MKKILFILLTAFLLQPFHHAFAQCKTSEKFSTNLILAKNQVALLAGRNTDSVYTKKLQASLYRSVNNLIGSIQTRVDYLTFVENAEDFTDELDDASVQSINASFMKNKFTSDALEFIKKETEIRLVNMELRVCLKKKINDYSDEEKVTIVAFLFNDDGPFEDLFYLSKEEVDLANAQLRKTQCSYFLASADLLTGYYNDWIK